MPLFKATQISQEEDYVVNNATFTVATDEVNQFLSLSCKISYKYILKVFLGKISGIK